MWFDLLPALIARVNLPFEPSQLTLPLSTLDLINLGLTGELIFATISLDDISNDDTAKSDITVSDILGALDE
jgi:hypothetical protein